MKDDLESRIAKIKLDDSLTEEAKKEQEADAEQQCVNITIRTCFEA